MLAHNWRESWNRPEDDNSERHGGCPRQHHHPSYQDDELLVRPRAGRSDIHEERDLGGPPERHFRNDHDDRGRDRDDSPDDPVPPHGEERNLGWDAAAWDDAGGFEAVLFGHLSDGLGSAGGFAPIVVFAIGDLDVEFNTLIQTTQIQNTLVLMNASNGGSIDVGGDLNAIGLQSASVEQSAGIMNLPEFS
jgi:hypothetical protein